MSPTIQPASSTFCDPYTPKIVLTLGRSGVAATANGPTIQILPDSHFILVGFMGSTNYDNFSGVLRAIGVNGSGRKLYGPPVVPNNFSVLITANGSDVLSKVPVPQGVICGSGYRAGLQMPLPVIYPPMTTFDTQFFNTAPNQLRDVGDTADIPLEINFSFYGYNVPNENLEKFLSSWPAMQEAARASGDGWLAAFTSQSIPGLTP